MFVNEYQPAAPIPASDLVGGGLGFIRPDGASRCTWKCGEDSANSPHVFESHEKRPTILPDILHAIGNTPLVRLNTIPASMGIKCEILAKCEFMNPGGSVKDRIAYRMIVDAERRGLLKPDSTIIEPSSGNTGIGLAMAAAVRGYRCIVVMPLKMSNEKVDTLKALGAEIVRTPTSASFDSPEGLIAVAQELCKQIPNSIILDQYRNAFNPIAHYEHTAQEIVDQCGGKVDVIVCSAGTGGTVCGIGRRIKEICPTCKVVAADPEGSILSLPDDLNKTNVSFYEVEGIGYDFVPTVLDRTVVDKWYKTNDNTSLPLARRLISEEGLLVGGSSGSAVAVALEVAKTMAEGERVVVILPDSMRNYMTKFISDPWMAIRGFKQTGAAAKTSWSDQPASVLSWRSLPLLDGSEKVITAIEKLKATGLDYSFVSQHGKILGVVTSTKLLSHLAEGKVALSDSVAKMVDPVRQVDEDMCLERLAAIVDKERFALLCTDKDTSGNVNGGTVPVPYKFITSQDILSFITTS